MAVIAHSQVRWARLAGFLYLFTYIVPITGWGIAGHYQVEGNFAETAHRIAASELFYRFGLSCVIVNWVLCMFLAMGLYAAVKPVNSTLALFGLLFRFAENTLALAFAILDFAMAQAYTRGDMSAAFTGKQLATLTALLSDAKAVQFNVSMVLLGTGSAFFFYLFFKSRYIPRALSMYGLCTCPIFIAASLGFLFWPQHSAKLQLGWYPLALAEVSIGLWLLVKGLNLQPGPPPG